MLPMPARPPRTRWAGFLLALLLVPGIARAELRTLETEHLRLVYYAPTQTFIAAYAARCFENSYRFHAARFGWTPSQKVTVILDDHSDYGNAAAWASPITASWTVSDRYSSATRFISRSTMPAISGQVKDLPPILMRGSSFGPRTIS